MRIAVFVVLLIWACGPTFNDSNAIPYDSSLEPYLGKWTYTYYTNGKTVDTLYMVRHGDWVQAQFAGELVFPEMENEKFIFRTNTEPRQYFEGKVMGNRLWGTLKYKTGQWSNQRINWEGEKIEE